MEMQRWSSRWKTKRWLMDSTVTAFITLTLVLQATSVRAGKIVTGQKSLVNFIWLKGDRAAIWENSVADDGDWRLTDLPGHGGIAYTYRRSISIVVKITGPYLSV